MKKKIILKRVFHRGRWRIMISFDIDQGLSVFVRQVENSRYNNTYKSWYVDDDEAVLKQVFAIFRDKAEIDISAITIRDRQKISELPERDNNLESLREKEVDMKHSAHLSGLVHLDNYIITRHFSSIYRDFAKTHANPDTNGN
jgi:hypothetical protein